MGFTLVHIPLGHGAEMSVPLSRGRRIKRCDIANCRSVKKLKRERLPVFLSFSLLQVGRIGFYLYNSPFLDIKKMKRIIPQKLWQMQFVQKIRFINCWKCMLSGPMWKFQMNKWVNWVHREVKWSASTTLKATSNAGLLLTL